MLMSLELSLNNQMKMSSDPSGLRDIIEVKCPHYILYEWPLKAKAFDWVT